MHTLADRQTDRQTRTHTDKTDGWTDRQTTVCVCVVCVWPHLFPSTTKMVSECVCVCGMRAAHLFPLDDEDDV